MKYLPLSWKSWPLLTGLVLSLLSHYLPTILALRPARDPYLERQAAALRPEFQGDLDALSAAPRYTINATVDPRTASLNGRLELRYTNTTGASLPDLIFQLLPNARSIYGGGSLTVTAAQRDGLPIPFNLTQKGIVLHLPLDPPLDPGTAATIQLDFNATLPRHCRQGYGIFSQLGTITSLAGWYPTLTLYQNGWQTPEIPRVGDAILADIGLFEVNLRIPADYQLASTGTVLERRLEDGSAVWHIVSGPARDFAVALSRQFEHRQTVIDGVTLNYYTLPTGRAGLSAARAQEMIAEAYTAYTRRFGPYPANELDVVDTAVTIGGYEFSGMIFVEYRQRLSSPGNYRYLLVHEIAHQWWYHLVGDNQITEPWLDEGLASYSAALYMEETYGKASGDGMLAAWKSSYGLRSPKQPPLNTPATSFSNWTSYRTTVYSHSALFIDTLRKELGDETFFSLLQTYLNRYRYRVATTNDFLQLAREISGRDLDAVIQPWFN